MGNHWVYGGFSTATATLQVYSRAGEVPKAMEAPARFRRDLMNIVKGDVKGSRTRVDTTTSIGWTTSGGRFGVSRLNRFRVISTKDLL